MGATACSSWVRGGGDTHVPGGHAALTPLDVPETFAEAPAELLALGSAHLTSRSLVVVPSRSGDTAEALAILEHCQRIGAKVVALTGTPGSPLAEHADVNFTNPVADDNSSESFYLQSLLIALAVMKCAASRRTAATCSRNSKGYRNCC